MKRLYVKQKAFTMRSQFTVTDENGNLRYTAEGEFWTFGHKLHVYDRYHVKTGFIKQVVWSWKSRYDVYVDDIYMAQIVREFTWFKPYYTIHGPGWQLTGNVLAHEFEVTENGSVLLNVHKKWMTWGDTYEIEINDVIDERLAVAMVLAIDCVAASQAAAAAAA
ncbi:MAG: LURP-one-related family protein [Solobacterium sp.]|nr:LURP-one-related family protein [Solobacterium sp.]